MEFSDDASCPCQSGKSVGACRCKGRFFVPIQVETAPPGLVTGVNLSRCYARWTQNCRAPLSADHAIAHSIREDFQRMPIRRTLSNGREVNVPVSSSGRKVLCRRHNSALSPLDEVGCRFVRALRNQLEHFRNEQRCDSHVLFNGFDIERWMLKVLCTLAHGSPVSRIYTSRNWRVPHACTRILFEGTKFPPGAGLYVPRVRHGRPDDGIFVAKIVGRVYETLRGAIIVEPTGTVSVLGLSMCIYGRDFDLYLTRPIEASQYSYRIRMHRVKNPAGGVAHVHLGWDEAPPTFRGEVAPIETETVRDDLLR